MLMLVDDIELLTEQIERLIIENGLLRSASKEQRELNGMLRVEYNLLKEDYTLVIKESSDALKNWSRWFDVWSIMLDGTCYDDAYDYYCQARDVSDIIEPLYKGINNV